MAALKYVVSHRKQLGKIPPDWKLRLMGWPASGLMAAARIICINPAYVPASPGEMRVS